MAFGCCCCLLGGSTLPLFRLDIYPPTYKKEECQRIFWLPVFVKDANGVCENKIAYFYTHFCISAVLQFLSVGPDLIAVWGLEAKKYLAVDSEGKIFTTVRLLSLYLNRILE